MRRLLPVVLLLAACTGTAEETTATTAPLAEPPTTTTRAPSTTTTEPTTTTTGEECVDRDGVRRTSRGFVCPPHLIGLMERGGSGRPDRRQRANSLIAGATHLPGTYATRQFENPMRVTRVEPFQSDGESPAVLTFDFPSGKEMVGFAGEAATQMAALPDATPDNRPEGFEWKADVSSQALTVDGRPGIVTEYRVECLVDDNAHCNFQIDGLQRWSQIHGSRVAVVVVEMSDDEMLTVVVMTEDAASFDTYWTEVAQPILDSIEFLDQ